MGMREEALKEAQESYSRRLRGLYNRRVICQHGFWTPWTEPDMHGLRRVRYCEICGTPQQQFRKSTDGPWPADRRAKGGNKS